MKEEEKDGGRKRRRKRRKKNFLDNKLLLCAWLFMGFFIPFSFHLVLCEVGIGRSGGGV